MRLVKQAKPRLGRTHRVNKSTDSDAASITKCVLVLRVWTRGEHSEDLSPASHVGNSPPLNARDILHRPTRPHHFEVVLTSKAYCAGNLHEKDGVRQRKVRNSETIGEHMCTRDDPRRKVSVIVTSHAVAMDTWVSCPESQPHISDSKIAGKGVENRSLHLVVVVSAMAEQRTAAHGKLFSQPWFWRWRATGGNNSDHSR